MNYNVIFILSNAVICLEIELLTFHPTILKEVMYQAKCGIGTFTDIICFVN